jgi:hypothetical protein
MPSTSRIRVMLGGLALAVAMTQAAAAQQPPAATVPTAGHPAVGSWFGKAQQLCPAGVAPSACSNSSPAISLFMTPTLTSDGLFLGNDSMSLGGLPFGPHTTAHGTWNATSPTGFEADYMFMLNAYPPQGDGAIQGLRFKWQGQVLDANTLIGYVNIYFSDPIQTSWNQLLDNEYPLFPGSANIIVTPPTGFVKDPTLCHTTGCPLVFKFTIKRVAP